MPRRAPPPPPASDPNTVICKVTKVPSHSKGNNSCINTPADFTKIIMQWLLRIMIKHQMIRKRLFPPLPCAIAPLRLSRALTNFSGGFMGDVAFIKAKWRPRSAGVLPNPTIFSIPHSPYLLIPYPADGMPTRHSRCAKDLSTKSVVASTDDPPFFARSFMVSAVPIAASARPALTACNCAVVFGT
ncbi:Uncharacterised protein [Klebsiella michiganensis]|uniref:Uncharacterized protein n=1 Tax=Klebsiella michiganensis TaxID=1134687 RepID=A0A7H4PRE9_9ENTR|nr:Uncharacterised protein [Klebsiella michiganensis]